MHEYRELDLDLDDLIINRFYFDFEEFLVGFSDAERTFFRMRRSRDLRRLRKLYIMQHYTYIHYVRRLSGVIDIPLDECGLIMSA